MALAFLYVGGVMMFLFGAMAYGLVSTLRGLGLGWMALAMGAFISAALSFILTVFSMQSQIFSAKDNDMLFAMPLTGLQIGASRMLSLLLLGVCLFRPGDDPHRGGIWVPDAAVVRLLPAAGAAAPVAASVALVAGRCGWGICLPCSPGSAGLKT